MKTIYFSFIIGLVWCTVHHSQAQLLLTERHEITLENDHNEEYDMISLKEKGAIIYGVQKPFQYAKVKEFRFEFLDTLLNVVRKQSFMLPFRFTQSRIVFYDEARFLYLLTQDDINKEVYIFRLNVNSGTNDLHEVKLPLRMDIQEFRVVDEVIYLIGLFERKSVVLSYSFIERLPKVLPSFFEDREEVRNVHSDLKNNQINFVIGSVDNRDCKLFIKPYSNLIGAKRRLEIVGKDRELKRRTFKDARLLTQSNNQKLVFGTYSFNCSNSYQGLYAARFDNEEQESLLIHRFTDMGNFFNHYNTKRAERFGKKVDKKNTQGKDYQLNYKLRMQDELIVRNKDILVCVESYYSQFQNTNPFSPSTATSYMYSNTGLWNRNLIPAQIQTQNQNRVNRYNYGIICGFDSKGRLLWDNVMKIDDLETDVLHNVLQIGSMGDSVVLAYLKEDAVYSKLIYRYQTIRKEKMQEIQEVMPDYKFHSSSESRLIHWYSSHYLFAGIQRMKGNTQNEVGGRKVFHLTKLSYQLQDEKLTKREQRKKERAKAIQEAKEEKMKKSEQERRKKAPQKKN